MTQLDYANKQLELANNILQSCLNDGAGNEESIELAKKLYDSCKRVLKDANLILNCLILNISKHMEMKKQNLHKTLSTKDIFLFMLYLLGVIFATSPLWYNLFVIK